MMTAPTGTSPASQAFWAWSSAMRMAYSSLGRIMVGLRRGAPILSGGAGQRPAAQLFIAALPDQAADEHELAGGPAQRWHQGLRLDALVAVEQRDRKSVV